MFDKYESCFIDKRKLNKVTDKLAEIIDVLKNSNQPMRVKEIGEIVYGEKLYCSPNITNTSLINHITHVLRTLRQNGFVKREEIDGEPFEVTREEYVRFTPKYIKVHDDAGNTYNMANPAYDPYRLDGEWCNVTKTVTPKIGLYSWIEG
jgi:DNA-binding HxlR family transcriptional regulator